MAVLSRTSTFDLDNRVVSDTTDTISGSTTTRNVQTYDYKLWNGATYTGIDQGAVTHVRNVQTVNGSGAITTNTDYTYQWWDDAKQSQIRINATNPANPNTGSWAPGFSDLAYDVNGHISKLTDTAGNRTLTYQSDAYGQVLVREEKIGATLGPRQLYYYFDGKRIGDVGNNGISTTQFDYAQVLAQRGQTQSASKNGFRGGTPVSSADFDQNYQPINDTYPGTASSIYTVRSGDTLRSIAQSAWGDANLWYLIADANGLTSATALTAGQRLVIPNKVTNFHNTSETFKPYNPGEAIGDTMPTLPEQPAPPPPPKKKGCGVLGQILLIAIAVAVTIATHGAAAGIASSILGAGASATAVSVVGGALAAVAGSIASQVVGVATGLQDKFSFKSVALAAIGGAVGGGLTNVNAFGATGLGKLTTVANDVARGALGNALTQGISVATGLQQKFDWTGVAVGGIVAGVGGAVSRALIGKVGANGQPIRANGDAVKSTTFNSADGIGNGLVSGLASGIAGAATRTLIEGSDFGDNLLAVLPDIIGSTIGRAVGNAINSDIAARKAVVAARRARAATQLAYGTDVPQMPGQPVVVNDVNPPLLATFEPKALKPDELAKLKDAGYGPARIRQIDNALTAQALAKEKSPSEALPGGARKRVLETLATDDVQYDKLKSLPKPLQNAVIDTDVQVISVRSQIAAATISTDGTTIANIKFSRSDYNLSTYLGLYDRVHIGQANSITNPSSVQGNPGVVLAGQTAAKVAEALLADAVATGKKAPDGSYLGNVSGDLPGLRDFAYGISSSTSSARVDGQLGKHEKVLSIESNSGQFFVTKIQIVGEYGGQNIKVTPNSVAVLHSHQQHDRGPGDGDPSSSWRATRPIPNFTVGGTGNNFVLTEVGRFNDQVMFRKIGPGGVMVRQVTVKWGNLPGDKTFPNPDPNASHSQDYDP